MILKLCALAVGDSLRGASSGNDFLLAGGKVVMNIIPLKRNLSGYLTLPPPLYSLPHLESVGSWIDKQIDEQVAG